MKKNYFFSLLCMLMCMFATSAKADGFADILGKYQFTATMTVADGQDASKLSDNCEVTISKDGSYVYMDGLAGSDRGGHMISDVADGKVIIKNWNDSNTGNFAGALYFSTMDAINPWAGTSPMPDFVMVLDESGNMTLPDFTVITVSDYSSATGTVVATFTNAKLTVKEKETTEVTNIAGNYTYTHGNGTWDYDKESAYSPDFSFTLTATDATNKNYTGVFNMGEGMNPITLEGTFDGMTLKLAYDKPCLNEEKHLYLGNPNGRLNAYGFKFGMIKKGVFSLDGVVTLLEALPTPTAENPDSITVSTLQWYVNGKAKDPSQEETGAEVDFTGTYTIVADYMDANNDWATVADDKVTFTVAKDEYGYFVTSFAGCSDIPYGGLGAAVDPSDPSKLLITPGYIQLLSTDAELDAGVYKYLTLTDMNGQYTSIALTKTADGYTFDSFALGTTVWGEAEVAFTKYYNNIKSVTKEGAAPSEKPSIAGDYTFTGLYCTMDNPTGVEKSFNIKIEENPYYEQYGGTKYLVTEFDGTAIYQLTYGGASLEIADENAWPVKAYVPAGTLIGGEYPAFLAVYDYYSVAEKNAFEITFNEDGTCSMWGFAINEFSYDTMSAGALVAWYADGSITLTRGKYEDTAIASAKADSKATETYDLTGRKTTAKKGFMIRGGKLIYVK